jgi:hypothetical protein
MLAAPWRVTKTMFLQEHFCTLLLWAGGGSLVSDNPLDSVPAGTLDAFCTQIRFTHSNSSLLLKRLADYAAQ